MVNPDKRVQVFIALRGEQGLCEKVRDELKPRLEALHAAGLIAPDVLLEQDWKGVRDWADESARLDEVLRAQETCTARLEKQIEELKRIVMGAS